MKREQLEQLREELLRERPGIARRSASGRRVNMGIGGQHERCLYRGALGYDNHPADVGTELYERGKTSR